MKQTKKWQAAKFGVVAAAALALSAPQAWASPVGHVTIQASIPEYMSIAMGSSMASIHTTASQLENGVTDANSSESALVPITISSNVGGQVVVRVKSLVPDDNKVNAITPEDLRLQVVNTGGGSAVTRYFRNYNTLVPRYDQPSARLWTHFYTEGVRTKTFTVKFQHRNANLYRGRTQPYTNTVQFTIVKGG